MGKGVKRFVAFFLCLIMVLSLIPSQNAYAATKTNISKCTIKLSKTSYSYTGSACKPTVTVKYGKKTLKIGTDFTVKYSSNTNPGTATVTVTGKGKYTGSVKKTFKIKNGLTVSLSKTSYTYTGSACKPSVTAKSGKTKLASKYYSVTYKNNTNVGTASVVVKGKGKYKGKNAYITFKINAKSVAKTTVTLSKTSYTYSGSAFEPTVTVKDGSKTLKKDTDYSVKYANNTNAGTATVTITGKGNYTATAKKTYTIAKKSIAGSVITLSKTSYIYSGKECKPTVVVKVGDKTLVKDTNYTVSYKNNVNIGTAAVVVTGKGNYSGTAKKTFLIKAAPVNYSLSETSKTINVGDNTAYITINGYKDGVDIKVTSSNSDLISAGHNGGGKIELYARDPGEATITVVVGGKTLKCIVIAVMEGGTDDPEESSKSKNIGNITQYVGEAWGFSFDDNMASEMGLTSVNHADVEWVSDDASVATVEPYPAVLGNSSEVYITFVGAGETKIHAKYGEYEEYLDVTCLAIDDAYMSVAKNDGNSYSTSTSGDSVTGIEFGREANSVIGQVALEGAESKAFNNISGFTTYTKDNVLYVFVTDAWNNRVMVYKSTAPTPTILDAIADSAGNIKEPVLVLGQANATSSRPGCGMSNLNWCMDCEVDSRGRLYVADTNNNRIQVWDDIASKVDAGVSGIEADHSITWVSSDHSDVNNHLNWVWALEIVIVDNEEKLVVTSTGNSEMLIWNTLPETWTEYSDEELQYVTENYYPDLFMRYKWGDSPRTISWTGNQLLIGDENIADYRNSEGREAGVRVFNSWPTVELINGKGLAPNEITIQTGADSSYIQSVYVSDSSNQYEDFSALDDYGEGIIVGDKLYFASSMSIQIFNDGVIKQGVKPDRNVQKTLNNTGLTGDTSGLSGYAPAATGGLQQMIYEASTGNLYLAMHFGGGIAVWENAASQFENATQPASEAGTNIYSCPFPEYRIGATHYDYDTKSEYAKIMQLHSPIPESDGEHLVVLNDFDKVLRVYKNIPTSSGALPDYAYTLPFESGDVDLYKDADGKVTMMLTARTQNIIYIWKDYKFDGALPDEVISKGMGGVYFPNEAFIDIEYDGTYTYLNAAKPDGSRQVVVFEGIVSKESKPIAYIDGTSSSNRELSIDQYHGQVTSNGEYISIVADKGNVMIFTTSQIASGTADNPVHLTRDDASVVNQVNYGDAATAENDTDGNFEVCTGNHFNIYKKDDKVYHIRNVFYGAIDSVITDDGKFIVCEGAEYEVIIWNSVQDAIDGASPVSIIGRGESEYDFDSQAGIYGYHDRRLQTYKDSLAMPYYLTYDGTNLWVGEFKFSNRLLRFNLK
ncbi:MAG: hypothetical protein SPD93_06390 [Lachnospiraceae bacterium]|nr:hypothetical protein [Lachnospiraceae bacterium]